MVLILFPYIFMRPIIYQPIVSFRVAVGLVPTAIDPTGNINQLINSFAISVPTGAANVFFGDGNVTVTTGLEIIAGAGPIQFLIQDERMKYEVLVPLNNMAEVLGCKTVDKFDVPLVVWDLSQVFLIGTVATNVAVSTFKMQFV